MLPPWNLVLPVELSSTLERLVFNLTPPLRVVSEAMGDPVLPLVPMRMAPALPLLVAVVSINPDPVMESGAALEGATAMAPPAPLAVDWVVSWEPPESSSEPASTVMAAPVPEPAVLLTTWPPLRETEVPLRVIAPPLPEPLFSLLRLPLIDRVPALRSAMLPPFLAVILLPWLMLVPPASLVARKRSEEVLLAPVPVRVKERSRFWPG